MHLCTLCASSSTEVVGSSSGVSDSRYFSCAVCGLVFLNPFKALSAAAEYSRYLRHNNSDLDPRYLAFLAQLSDRVHRYLEDSSAKRIAILDYGSGPGPAMQQHFSSEHFEFFSYDPYFAPSAKLLTTHYDVILCSETAEHFSDPADEFRRLSSLLLPGGYLGLMTLFLPDDVDVLSWWYARDPTHRSFYREKTLGYLAETYGLELLESTERVVVFQKAFPKKEA